MTDLDMWASNQADARTEWIEFVMGPFPDRMDEMPRRYRINVSFMLSNWKCIFGEGCPGVLVSGAMTDRGCCQIGVHIERDELARVNKYVKMLTPADLDSELLKDVKQNGWKYNETDEEHRSDGYTKHTRVVDGACVLANRAGGSSGQIGCSLHVLAKRIGISPTETKPNICWQLPVVAQEEYDEDRDEYVITVTNTPGEQWGSRYTTEVTHPGWFCTETPDAYRGDDTVYVTNEDSLRKQMGDDAYDKMSAELDQLARRFRMPGEKIHNGQPLIPLMVAKRMGEWKIDAADPDSETTDESKEALKRSANYSA